MLWLLFLFGIGAAGDWSHYGGDAGGTRYSTAAQINRNNVTQLKKAWEYHTGALSKKGDANGKAAFEATPILFDGLLYVSTPFNDVMALDPATGAERWHFDAAISHDASFSEVTSRGVAAWTDAKANSGATCRSRIFEGTIDARLIALDAKTGKACESFGHSGTVNLTDNIGTVDKGNYQVTSPPAISGDTVVIGSSIGDNRAVDVERGVIRGYDARTGALKWTWDPIPWAEKQSPRTGAANAWSILSVDPARDLVFVPTGSAAPDFYGGLRPGDDKWANSIVALRASTGVLVWGYQVVHHDLWDYDIASQPALITYKGRPAVVVNTKMGNVFVLDRETGKPLHEVRERPVPKSDVAGENASPTQPVPDWQALVPQGKLTAADMYAGDPDLQKSCVERLQGHRSEGIFTPPSLNGSIVFPGNVGGVNWGGAAVDEAHAIMFANTDRIATIVRLIPQADLPKTSLHEGNRYGGELGRQRGAPYAMYREWLMSEQRVPCNQPPWGALVAFDLNKGRVLWQAPVGAFRPGSKNGTLLLGGPIVTAGGVVFTGGSMDSTFHAFDAQSGAEVWKADLPASAQSTPMTYTYNGKQYVVICAGGHGKLGTKQGDSVIAFALP